MVLNGLTLLYRVKLIYKATHGRHKRGLNSQGCLWLKYIRILSHGQTMKGKWSLTMGGF